MIGILLLIVVIGLFVWLYKRNSNETETGETKAASLSPEQELKAKISKKIAEIKASPDWNKLIVEGVPTDTTLNQHYAANAIYALEQSGDITGSTFTALGTDEYTFTRKNF